MLFAVCVFLGNTKDPKIAAVTKKQESAPQNNLAKHLIARAESLSRCGERNESTISRSKFRYLLHEKMLKNEGIIHKLGALFIRNKGNYT